MTMATDLRAKLAASLHPMTHAVLDVEPMRIAGLEIPRGEGLSKSQRIDLALDGHFLMTILVKVHVVHDLSLEFGIRIFIAFEIVFIEMLLHQAFGKLKSIDAYFEINRFGRDVQRRNGLFCFGLYIFDRCGRIKRNAGIA